MSWRPAAGAEAAGGSVAGDRLRREHATGDHDVGLGVGRHVRGDALHPWVSRASGAIAAGRVLTSLAGNPNQLPALLRLAADAVAARRALIMRMKILVQASKS